MLKCAGAVMDPTGVLLTDWSLSVKVGDLVRWTHPKATGFGIVVADPKESWGCDSPVVAVVWFDGKHHGSYPMGHEYMELVRESR